MTIHTRPSARDFDEKLREMGNYLWDLEQAADLASERGDEAEVERTEGRIRELARKAAGFAARPGAHRALAAYVAGLACRMARDWEGGAHWFEAVVELQPDNGDAWLELTWCLAELRRWDRCVAAARQSTRLYPQASAGWGNLAMALRSAGDRPGALRAVERALALDGQDARNRQLWEELSG